MGLAQIIIYVTIAIGVYLLYKKVLKPFFKLPEITKKHTIDNSADKYAEIIEPYDEHMELENYDQQDIENARRLLRVPKTTYVTRTNARENNDNVMDHIDETLYHGNPQLLHHIVGLRERYRQVPLEDMRRRRVKRRQDFMQQHEVDLRNAKKGKTKGFKVNRNRNGNMVAILDANGNVDVHTIVDNFGNPDQDQEAFIEEQRVLLDAVRLLNQHDRLRNHMQNNKAVEQALAVKRHEGAKSQEIRIDKNNTHDRTVVDAVAKGYNIIKQDVREKIQNDVMLTDLKLYMDELCDKKVITSDKREHAKMTLSNMVKHNSKVSSVGDRELNVLANVWTYANEHKTKEISENLKESLVNRLADCVDKNRVCCPTGRVDRVVDTLSGIDNKVTIVSKDIIKREMLDVASKVTKDMDEAASREILDALHEDNPTEDQQRFLDTYDQLKKDNIHDELKKRYLATNLVTEKEYESLTDWVKYI